MIHLITREVKPEVKPVPNLSPTRKLYPKFRQRPCEGTVRGKLQIGGRHQSDSE
jgi:hypothetical protein